RADRSDRRGVRLGARRPPRRVPQPPRRPVGDLDDERDLRNGQEASPIIEGSMATLYPFRALRPRPADAARIAAVPYDVANTDEARALADADPPRFPRGSHAG